MSRIEGGLLAVLGQVLVLVCASMTHGQDLVHGRFYRLEVVGKPGGTPVATVQAQGPSINKFGTVAFAGNAAVGTPAIYVTDLGIPTPTPREIIQAINKPLSFQGGLQINDSTHVVGLEVEQSQDPHGFHYQFLQNYDATPPGPYLATLIAGAANPAFNDFHQIYYPATLNNADQPAFGALKLVGMNNVHRLVTGVRPTFNQIDVATTTPGPLRPMMADDGRVVVRAGPNPTDPIQLYSFDLSSCEDIATTAMGFASLGQSPGISDNGDVVVFEGVLTDAGAAALGTNPGDGIFASLNMPVPRTRRIIRVASRRAEKLGPGMMGNQDGVCDPGETCTTGPADLGFDQAGLTLFLSTFDAAARVGVTHLPVSPSGIANDTFVVTFIATPNNPSAPPSHFSEQPGLWSVRVDIKDVGGGQLVEKPSTPIPVVQIGDHIGSALVTGPLYVYDPVASAPTDDSGAPRTERRGVVP